MRRRVFLATAGSFLTAGCSSLLGGDGGEQGVDPSGYYEEDLAVSDDRDLSVPDKFKEGFNSDVDIDSVDFEDMEFDFNSSAVDAEFGDADWVLEDMEEETTTTEADERAARLVQIGGRKLIEAWDIYRGFAGDEASLLDVTPAVDEINARTVRSKVREAKPPLKEAGKHATEGQKVNILALQQIGVFLVQASQTDEKLKTAYDEFAWATERLYAENLTQASSAKYRLEDYIEEARKPYERLTEETDESSAKSFPPVSEENFQTKVRRLDDALYVLDKHKEGIGRMVSGIEQLQDGVPRYINREFDEAIRPLMRATSRFGMAAYSFNPFKSAPGIKEKSDEAKNVAQALEDGTRALERSARAYTEEKRVAYYEAQRKSESAYKSNDIVHRMRTPKKIIL